jgi:hypothetical protein
MAVVLFVSTSLPISGSTRRIIKAKDNDDVMKLGEV